ncbi:MAG: hypothetical protein IH865_13365 [Chloroflexi bacterium]|nr:hypothetical protein [Chloroflexota bacterium]
MLNDVRTLPPLRLIAWIAIVAALAAIFLVSPSYAQEAPDASPEASDASPEAPDEQDTQETGTRVFLEIEAPGGEPVNKGDTFFVHVMVADVENLSAFDFQLGYDRERVQPVSRDDDDSGGTPTADGELGVGVEGGDVRVQGELGQFVADSPRGSLCSGPFVRGSLQDRVLALCAGVAAPPCLGGPEGVDGSGRLGTVVFKSRGGETTDIVLVQSNLVLDDVEPPCDPELDLTLIRIPHDSGGPVTVLLSGGGGSSVLLIVIIAVVVVAVLGGGLGGFLLYQRRNASSVASD